MKSGLYIAKINGRNALNGKRYGMTVHGDFDAKGGESIFEVLAALSDDLATVAKEMELPDSIQVTIELKGGKP